MSSDEIWTVAAGEKDWVALIKGWTQVARSSSPLSSLRKLLQPEEIPSGIRVELVVEF